MSSSGQGRGAEGEEEVGSSRYAGAAGSGDIGPEGTIRGRGGFRSQELHTIPEGVRQVRSSAEADGQPMEVLANFIRIEPMKEKQIYAYRVDFKPQVESSRLRTSLFRRHTGDLLPNAIFDGAFEARASRKLPQQTTVVSASDRDQPDQKWEIIIKLVGEVNHGSFEMVRVYNMHMKENLRTLQFFQVQSGAYIHPALYTRVGQNTNLLMVRGFRTGANVHEEDNILMNLESVHKLIQEQNLLAQMTQMGRGPGGQEAIKAQLIGKLVVTSYNKIVYRVEDVNFALSPRSTFEDRQTGNQISYIEYYRTKHGKTIQEEGQPMLLVVQNNRRRQGEEQGGGDRKDIYVVPELCNMAGLTDFQRNDGRLRTDLIRSSQIDPKIRVEHMNTLIRKLHEDQTVAARLTEWGYSYGREPIRVKARILPLEKIGAGRHANSQPASWPKVDAAGSFENLVKNDSLAKAPRIPKMVMLIARSEADAEVSIREKLKQGFQRIGLVVDDFDTVRMLEGNSPHHYVQYLKQLAPDVTCAIVIVTNQNREKYNAIKKLASVERGLITQVVTARLMADVKKAAGAAVKIGIQIAAKIGGEPWYVFLPLSNVMICGYDTYHDTAQRGRSYGAFVASMNRKLTSWYSKADSHDHLDELSSHMRENLTLAMRRWKELNQGQELKKIFIYRDGVGDGQLDHVYNIELKQIHEAIKSIDNQITLTFIVVNKRIGARFYMCNNNSYINPPPGSVIDNVVTRKERYDFYLVSQSTRFGVVAPTYYNIIYDDSGIPADRHQMMAFKMCFLYYNWAGTVRVPAPCQYAHKLALLCGEHLHGVPNANLDDRLHFL